MARGQIEKRGYYDIARQRMCLCCYNIKQILKSSLLFLIKSLGSDNTLGSFPVNWHRIAHTLAQSCPFAVNPNLLYLVQSKLCNAAVPVGTAVFHL